jgi:hypothetical protein
VAALPFAARVGSNMLDRAGDRLPKLRKVHSWCARLDRLPAFAAVAVVAALVGYFGYVWTEAISRRSVPLAVLFSRGYDRAILISIGVVFALLELTLSRETARASRPSLPACVRLGPVCVSVNRTLPPRLWAEGRESSTACRACARRTARPPSGPGAGCERPGEYR